MHVQRKDGTLWHAPFIPVEVINRFGSSMKVVALLDSGADTTVVPKDLADLLGLKEGPSVIESGGIGGQVKVKEAKLSFSIKGQREHYRLVVRCLVLQDENVDLPLLLGRNGFFEQFHITFKQGEEKIVLKKITPQRKC